MMNRTRLFCIASALAAVSTQSHATAADDAIFDNGVAAGDVTPTSVVLWAHSTFQAIDGSYPVIFQYSTSPKFKKAISIPVTQTSYNVPAKVKLTDLNPHTDYFYRVVLPKILKI